MTYQNNKKLYDSKIIGEYELSTAANSYATAKAQVAMLKADAKALEEIMEKAQNDMTNQLFEFQTSPT